MITSAGLLAYRRRDGEIEVFLVHPGGPYNKKKDEGAWSIPKGEFGDGERPIDAARREFTEETGFPTEGDFLPLGEVKQRSGKMVHAWAFETDFDARMLVSNTFEMEWPPRSGTMQAFPEVDRGEWFPVDVARTKMIAGQVVFLDRLLELAIR